MADKCRLPYSCEVFARRRAGPNYEKDYDIASGGAQSAFAGNGTGIKLLPPAAFRYELWSFGFRCGRILLENCYANDLVYDDAMELYRSYKYGNHALVRVFADFQQIVKFRYGGSDDKDECRW